MDQREEQTPPTNGDVGDVLIHAIQQAEIKAYSEFVEGVERATASILAEA